MSTKEPAARSRGKGVYDSILAAIRDGVYRPGEPLREEEVAARMGVSRTPVREALGRLQERGLVEQAAGRGVAVAVLSTGQVFELYAMREKLEGIAARFAAHHATAAEMRNLERLNAEFAKAPDAASAARLNRQFHARIYDATRNRYLRQAVEGLHEAIALLPDTTFVHPGRTATAAREHAALVEAISAHDGERAEKAAVSHIQEALKVRLLVLDPEAD